MKPVGFALCPIEAACETCDVDVLELKPLCPMKGADPDFVLALADVPIQPRDLDIEMAVGKGKIPAKATSYRLR